MIDACTHDAIVFLKLFFISFAPRICTMPCSECRTESFVGGVAEEVERKRFLYIWDVQSSIPKADACVVEDPGVRKENGPEKK